MKTSHWIIGVACGVLALWSVGAPERAHRAADFAWFTTLGFPDVKDLKFVRYVYGSSTTGGPAEARWGFKEVRLSAEDALYLCLLFPRAKFVFLVRDPLDAYASYKVWRSWYLRWPEDQVRTAWAYAGLWADLAGGFLDQVAGLDWIVIRYEDLVPGGAATVAL